LRTSCFDAECKLDEEVMMKAGRPVSGTTWKLEKRFIQDVFFNGSFNGSEPWWQQY
jgi:hypothetical protein